MTDIMYLFIYLLLFDETVNSSDHEASSGIMISELLILNNVEEI